MCVADCEEQKSLFSSCASRWFIIHCISFRKNILVSFFIAAVLVYVLIAVQSEQNSIFQVYLTLPTSSDNSSTAPQVTKRNSQCSAAKKVAFMKTHKCASSTVENIVYRHAHRQRLNVAIPMNGNYLSTLNLFNSSILSKTPWGRLKMDVFTLHNRWNYAEVVKLMGQSVRTFSIVRKPVDLFESLYSYMALNGTFDVDLKGFVHLLRENRTNDILQKRRAGYLGRNQLAWDFGFDPVVYDWPPDLKVIQRHIHKLDREFQLVMIVERMDESLVLLADLLCWPLEWITHLDLNVRKPEMKVEAGQQLDEEDRLFLADFLRLDIEIYNYFCRRFEERLTQFNSKDGQRMKKQLRLLQEVNNKVKEDCVIQSIGNEELVGKFHDSFSSGVMGYVINQTVPGCDLFGWSENAFIDYFKEEMTNRTNRVLS